MKIWIKTVPFSDELEKITYLTTVYDTFDESEKSDIGEGFFVDSELPIPMHQEGFIPVMYFDKLQKTLKIVYEVRPISIEQRISELQDAINALIISGLGG